MLPAPKVFQHDALQLFGQDRVEQLELDAREYLQYADGHVLQLCQLQGAVHPGRADGAFVVADVHPGGGQRRIVGGGEGLQAVRRALHRPVAPQQLTAEIKAHLVHHALGCNEQAGDQIVPPVAAQLAQRDLATGEHHRLVQIFQHEAQRRSGVGHGVGAVQHHKAVELMVPVRDGLADGAPLVHGDVGGIQQRVHLHQLPVRHVRAGQLRNGGKPARKAARLGRVALLAGHHADGAAGI